MAYRKKSALAAVVLLTFILTGCSIQTDIGKMMLIRAAAVDQSSTAEKNVRLTIESEKISAAGKPGEAQKKPLRIVAEGQTAFDASRNLSAYAEKNVFWGHAKYIIVGEAAAQEDIRKYLDFFVRDHECRLNAVVAVVQGQPGEKLLNISGEEEVTHKLTSLFENSKDLSVSRKITLIEFVEALNSKYSAAYLPSFSISEKPENPSGISLNGYAVFRGTRLQGYITGKEARGLNWIIGEVKSGIINVKDKDEKKVSLEIILAKSKIKTEIIDSVPNVRIEIKVNSNIGEMQGTADIFNDAALSGLAKQQSDVIRDEINSVLEYARQNNVDIFGFGEKIYHQYPVRWESIKDRWSELFPKAIVEIEIESNISNVYNISKPVRSWEGAQ